MMNNLKKALATLTMAFAAIQAHAVLVDNGTYTTDTDTELDWLDMSFTNGMSYNAVVSAITGGSLNGWRFATSSEFDTLINSAVGYTYTAISYDSTILSQMQNLISLMGSTYNSGTTYAYAVGYVDSASLSNADARQFGFHIPNGYVRPESSTSWDQNKDYAGSMQGSFLVRASAPSSKVPDAGSTSILLGLALAGLAIAKRRK